MALLTGIWSFIANGDEGTLTINTVDQYGNVQFGLQLNAFGLNATDTSAIRMGFWDESAQAITLANGYHGMNLYLFEGCQFQTPAQPAPGQDVTWNLAGLFTGFGTAGSNNVVANSRRHRFGWHATHTQML